jgi:hypothetical protein
MPQPALLRLCKKVLNGPWTVRRWHNVLARLLHLLQLLLNRLHLLYDLLRGTALPLLAALPLNRHWASAASPLPFCRRRVDGAVARNMAFSLSPVAF